MTSKPSAQPVGGQETTPSAPPYEQVYRLYVTAGSPVSTRAVVNARRAAIRTHRLSNGTEMHVESVASALRDSAGQPIGTLTVVRDVTPRLSSELRRVALIANCGFFIEPLKLGELVVIRDARSDTLTAVASRQLAEKDALAFVIVPVIEHGKLVALLFVNASLPRDWSTEDLRYIKDAADRIRVTTERAKGAAALREREQRLREVNEGLEAIVEARTRALMQAEEALRQAQKMEAVGQLAGGLAHDFNNLVAGMGASLQVLQTRLRQERYEGLDRYITMGRESVRRAASLTQRLLAFARRQMLDPKPTDVNRLGSSMEDLIRRTVGTEVELEVVGAGGLWFTRIDAPQLENSLLDLCINARDAMLPTGGRLTIETANKWLAERGVAELELTPGQYISICVTDTGTGIPPDIIKRVFDPFFTTKPLGQSTGLGLSMAYGFVRQSGGQIRICSEEGTGTTMCLYLPRFVVEVGVRELRVGPRRRFGAEDSSIRGAGRPARHGRRPAGRNERASGGGCSPRGAPRVQGFVHHGLCGKCSGREWPSGARHGDSDHAVRHRIVGAQGARDDQRLTPRPGSTWFVISKKV